MEIDFIQSSKKNQQMLQQSVKTQLMFNGPQ